jgi:hypothetical protein
MMNLSTMSSKLWEQSEVVRLLKGAPGTQYQEADDVNKAIIRDWVRSLLQRQPITVTFVKADGTDRQMRCTLNSDFIPTRLETKNNFVAFSSAASVDGLDIVRKPAKPKKEPDPHSIRVFDLELMEWRSFRFDRLKKVTAELNFE